MHTSAAGWTQPRENLSLQKRNQEMCTLPNLKSGVKKMWQGRPVAFSTASGQPHASSKSDCQGGPKAEKMEWSHNLYVFPATIHHTEAVFSIVREIYGREHNDPMDDLDVKMAILGHISECHSSRAAFHLGQEYEANSRTWGFKDATWMSTSLLCEKA